MPTLSLQDRLDYMADAQARVAADTLCLTKTATLTIPTTGRVELPDDLVALRAVYVGAVNVLEASTRSLLTFLSSGHALAEPAWGVIGRTFYYAPLPADSLVLTIIYHYRPAQLTSASELEVSGQYDLLVKDLTAASAALDTGETEVAIAQTAEYEVEAARLMRARRAQEGQGDRVRIMERYP